MNHLGPRKEPVVWTKEQEYTYMKDIILRWYRSDTHIGICKSDCPICNELYSIGEQLDEQQRRGEGQQISPSEP